MASEEWRTLPESPPDPETEKLQAEVKRWHDLAARSQAELANAQARMRRDVEERQKYAVENFAREVIPALDSLSKSVEAVTKAGGAAAVVEALQLVEKELLRGLAKGGIRPIDTAGKKFDPMFHEAVGTVPSATHEEQAVFAEVRRGYLIHDRVLRPAQVLVARRTPGGSDGRTSEPQEPESTKGEGREEAAKGGAG